MEARSSAEVILPVNPPVIQKFEISGWNIIPLENGKFAGDAQARVIILQGNESIRQIVPAYLLGTYSDQTGIVARVSLGHNKEQAVKALEIKEEKEIVLSEQEGKLSVVEGYFEIQTKETVN